MGADPRPVDWTELSAWYDAKQGDSGDLWHRALIDPALLRRIGEVAGRDVLDLACGNGYLARRLQRAGARVTAVDGSPGMAARARAWEARGPLGVRVLEADASHLTTLGDASFDLVYANMALMDLADARGAIREAGRVLRAFGRFVGSFDHPCFGGDAGASWVIERHGRRTTVSRRVHRYRDEFDDPGAWNLPDGTTVSTPAFHRPLAWYADAFRGAGLALTALDEPMPTPEFLASSPLGEAIAVIPVHLVVEAVRIPGLPAATRGP